MAKSLVTPQTEFKDLPQVLKVSEVAAFLNTHRSSIYRILNAKPKRLTFITVNGSIRIKKEALGRYLGNS